MWPWIVALAALLLANGIVAWFEIREANRTIDWATPDNLRTLYMADERATTSTTRTTASNVVPLATRTTKSRPTPKGEAAKRSS